GRAHLPDFKGGEPVRARALGQMGAGVRIARQEAPRPAHRLVGRRGHSGAGLDQLRQPGSRYRLCRARRHRLSRDPGDHAQAPHPVLRRQLQV
ncbi:MAG: NADH-ubiquinone oxidoreductase-related protein, partial [uncultured Sphingosinicella sp.]